MGLDGLVLICMVYNCESIKNKLVAQFSSITTVAVCMFENISQSRVII